MLMEDAECDWTRLGMFPAATCQRPRGQAVTNRKDVKSLHKMLHMWCAQEGRD
jgi:hypothetical protein